MDLCMRALMHGIALFVSKLYIYTKNLQKSRLLLDRWKVAM